MKKQSVVRIFELLHLLAIMVWFGAVGMSGVVAASVFGRMADLKPTLETYALYEGDHTLLAGGYIAGGVFTTLDFIQFIAATLALASFITMLLAGYSLNSVARVLRSILLLATMGLLSYHLFLLMPGMTQDLHMYWDLAQQGQTENADTFKNNFLALHETAANSLKGLTVLTLVSFCLAFWTNSDRTATQPASRSTPQPAKDAS